MATDGKVTALITPPPFWLGQWWSQWHNQNFIHLSCMPCHGTSSTHDADSHHFERQKQQSCYYQLLAAVFLAIYTGISHNLVGMHTCTWKKSMQLLTFLQSHNAPPLCHSYNGIRCVVEHTMSIYCNDNRIRSTNICFYELFLESQDFPPSFFCLQYILWTTKAGWKGWEWDINFTL